MRLFHIYIIFSFLTITNTNYVLANDTANTDSLLNILKNTKEEKSIPILRKLSSAFYSTDINKSYGYAKIALELSEKYQNEELKAYTNLQIADIYFEMSRFQNAIDHYEKALDYFYDQKPSDNLISIYTKLGHSEKMLSNFNNALFYYQKPINLYLEEKNKKISDAYNNIGSIYKLQGKFNESMEYHLKALKASNINFDQSELANTFKHIGSLFWKFSLYDSALVYFEKSLELYRDISDTLNEATTLSNIGVVFKDIGEYKKALDYNLKALELRTLKGKNKDIANSYNSIGSIYISTNEPDKALEFYFSSLKIRENIGDLLGIAQSQNNIALVYKQKNLFQESLEYFNKSLNNYNKIGNFSFIASSVNQIGGIYKKLNKYDLALENYLHTLKLRQKMGDQGEVASALNNIGIIYDEIGNYQKALESFSKSLEIKREIGDKKEIAYSLHIIGNTYLKLENYKKALEFYTESLTLRMDVGDKVNIANSLKSIGNTYLSLKDYTNSITYLNNAYKLRDEIGDIKGVSDIMNDIGNFYFEINNQDKAFEYFSKTITLCERTNDQYLMSLCNRKIGIIQLTKGLDIEGLSNINKSLNIAKSINNLELVKNAYFELFTYYNKKGDKNNALDNYINYTITKDTILAKYNSQKLVEIQMNFELEESHSEISRIENEITELNAEKKISELELKKQKNVRNLLFVIALIILTSGILLFYQFLSKRKTNLLLQEKINEVDLSNKLLKESEENLKILNATKDKFFSIIAHDLRNPFNALHGLTKHLLNHFDEYDEVEMKESVDLIYNSADNLLELLENLLQWSRTQRGKIQFTPKEINLSEIITKIFDLLNVNAKKKKINLINEILPDKVIAADQDMITVILRNLVLNAIKFSNPDSFIRISSKDYEKHTEISVLDNGIGISKENIQKLFRIDVHHSTSGTSEEQGSGLGLILCQEFVEKHNGKIWVESELNKGSIFKFTISNNIHI